MKSTRKNPHLSSLFARLVEGDVQAFSEIYKTYYNRLLRFGNIVHSDPEVVGDIIQDLFEWIFLNKEKLGEVTNFEVYLFLSLKRNIIRYIKKSGRSREIISDFLTLDTSGKVKKTREDELIIEEEKAFNHEWLKLQLDHLPSQQKEVIYLRYYEGLSYDEIAEILSKSNQVVRNYAFRGLSQLKKAYVLTR